MPGVRNIVYQLQRPITKDIHHYLRETEVGVLNAQMVVCATLGLKESGFAPDVGFDPNESEIFDHAPRIRTNNLGNMLVLETADLGQTTTQWQKSRYPERYHAMLHVVLKGIDTQIVPPDNNVRRHLADQGITLSRIVRQTYPGLAPPIPR